MVYYGIENDAQEMLDLEIWLAQAAQVVPLFMLIIWFTYLFRKEQRVWSTRMVDGERANSKLLQSLQRATSEKDQLAKTVSRLTEEVSVLKSSLEKQQDPVCEVEVQQPVVDIVFEDEPTQNEFEEKHSLRDEPVVTEEEPLPVDSSVSSRSSDVEDHPQIEGPSPVEMFRHNPTFGVALELLMKGCGDTVSLAPIFPKLCDVLMNQRIANSETAASRALATNDVSMLRLIANEELNTPNVKKAKRRLQVIDLDARLKEATAVADYDLLRNAIEQLEVFRSSQGGEEQQEEEIPEETIEAALDVFARKSSELKHILASSSTDLIKVSTALSQEMWTWQGGEMSEDDRDAIHRGLRIWSMLQTREELNEALTSKSMEELHQAVHAARLRGYVSHSPIFISSKRLVLLNDVRIRLDSAMRMDSCSLYQVLQEAETAMSAKEMNGLESEVSVDTSDLLSNLQKQVESQEDTLTGLIIDARKQFHFKAMEERMERVIQDTNNLVAMRQTLEEFKRLQTDGWIECETPQYRTLKRVLHRQTSLVVLSTLINESIADDKSIDLQEVLFNTASRLAFAELNGLEWDHPLLIQMKKEHSSILANHLKKILNLDIQVLMLLNVERVDDLFGVTEGEMRQAQLSRVTVRRILPHLNNLGRDALEFIDKEVTRLGRQHNLTLDLSL